MYAQQIASTLWKRSGKSVHLAFFSSLCAGVLAYLFRMTNTFFTTGDALNNLWFDGNMVWVRRWSSEWLSGLSTDLTMPAVNTLIAILAISVLAALIVWLLDIHSSLMAILTGFVLVCHPTIGATLCYLHNADAYMLAAMLSVLGFFLLERFRWGIIPAVILITIGTGTYQASVSLVVSLMFVKGMQLLLETPDTAKQLWLRILRWFLCIGLVLLLYYQLSQFFVERAGMAIIDYRTVSDMASVGTLQAIPENFINCYLDFAEQMNWPPSSAKHPLLGWLNIVIAATTVLLILPVFWLHHGKNLPRLAAVVLLLVFAPFFLCCIHIFNPGGVYSLMTYSTAGMYLLALLLADRLPELFAHKKALRIPTCLLNWTVVLCTAVCIFQWTVDANLTYYKAALDYENMYAQCTKFMDMAEDHEDYIGGMPILVIGDISYNETRTAPRMNATISYYAFMTQVLGSAMPFGIANEVTDQARLIAETPDFITMSCYPAEDSIQVIEDCMVIKLSEEVK